MFFLFFLPQVALPQWASLPKGEISIGPHEILVEVAITAEEQQRGLMFRDSLPPDEGMLFCYSKPRVMHFWMKNTSLTLSIAFLDKDGVIFQIEPMEPFDEKTIDSKEKSSYALEMNQGWFADRGIKVGDKVDLSALAKAGIWPQKQPAH